MYLRYEATQKEAICFGLVYIHYYLYIHSILFLKHFFLTMSFKSSFKAI